MGFGYFEIVFNWILDMNWALRLKALGKIFFFYYFFKRLILVFASVLVGALEEAYFSRAQGRAWCKSILFIPLYPHVLVSPSSIDCRYRSSLSCSLMQYSIEFRLISSLNSHTLVINSLRTITFVKIKDTKIT